MQDFPFDIVGFDLDGTLLDTAEDLAAALNHALAGLGRPTLPVAAVRGMIGRGTRHMLDLGLAATGGSDAALLEATYPALLDHYAAHIAVHSRPYPGLEDALEALSARGVALAVVTNKLERLAVQLLDETGLDRHFSVVIGGDTTPEPKPSGTPIREMVRRCGGGPGAFVGDSIYDILAARDAGVPSVAVRFGFLGDDAEPLEADATIDDFAALVPTLEWLGVQAGR